MTVQQSCSSDRGVCQLHRPTFVFTLCYQTSAHIRDLIINWKNAYIEAKAKILFQPRIQ